LREFDGAPSLLKRSGNKVNAHLQPTSNHWRCGGPLGRAYLQNEKLVSPILRILAAAVACLAGIAQAQTDDPSAKPITGTLLLDPAPITLTASFSRPATPSTLELATRFIGDQIDNKRNAGAAEEAMIDRLWKASFLRFIPIKPGDHPANMNSPVEKDVDDPFFTPAYLTVVNRQLDREVAASDKRAKFLFGH
jgi:hypothetical protein